MSRADQRPAGHHGSGEADFAPVFAALGDSNRLRLITRLSDGQPRSITQLTGGLGLTRQGVTKHLRVLEEAGLVSSIRAGRESQFALQPEPVAQARTYLETVSMQWDDALGRLQRFVETPGKAGKAEGDPPDLRASGLGRRRTTRAPRR